DEARLTTGTLEIDRIGFNLSAREAQVGKITLGHLDLALARNASGEIDWLAPLDNAGNEQPPATDDAADSPAFRWSVESIALADSQVHWQDHQPATTANVTLKQLSVVTGKLSSELEEPVTYKATAALADGGTLSVQGQA